MTHLCDSLAGAAMAERSRTSASPGRANRPRELVVVKVGLLDGTEASMEVEVCCPRRSETRLQKY